MLPALGPLFGPFFAMVVLARTFLLVRSALTRSLDRALTVGCLVLTLTSLTTMALARTAVWDAFAGWLLRF